ncbi:unnamed protein product [Brachionus calyciflorus]|uniref:Ashwin n=1 Tax=Brachionus calyciflorus TaxID=104777 RepID=A0A814BP13_9BILA|nr:unnamed protein product [Brachionus calyciflorus]
MDIEPGLLSVSDLKTALLNKGIKLCDTESKEDLIFLYHKYIKPQPQRIRRSKANVDVPTKIICLKTEQISLNEAFERREKRFKSSNNDVEMIQVDQKPGTSSQSSPKKIFLKRPLLNDTGNFVDHIKKTKFN